MPEFVGADAQGFDALTSRVKRDAAVLVMQRLCSEKVQQVVSPLLEDSISHVLGAAPAGKWLHFELDVDAKSPILYFRYPSTQTQGFDYVRREVKLEACGLAVTKELRDGGLTTHESPKRLKFFMHNRF